MDSTKTEVIAIFDIGKTNKKFLLFDSGLNIIHREDKTFREIHDDDGMECDDIESIVSWMRSLLTDTIKNSNFEIRALNFTTYGASLMHIDKDGKMVTPLYNYLRPMPEGVLEGFYETWGGCEEFSRRTASPAMGMLNSGLQILWLKKKKPDLYSRITTTLNLPQYLSYTFTGQKVADYTYLGCHSALWDFDKMQYHPWLKAEHISLPEPVLSSEVYDVQIEGTSVKTGVGIHDSSASLVPYLKNSDKPFILVSTGTWWVFMNPFNSEPLTTEQLRNKALCFMTVDKQQVKSTTVFLGHLHDMNVTRLDEHFGVAGELYKTIKIKRSKISKLLGRKDGRVFFRNGIPAGEIDTEVDLSDFLTYADAYHQMIFDLVDLGLESYRQIIAAGDITEIVYVTGGFAKNDTFVRILAARLPDKRVYSSSVDDATALGAAMVVYESAFGKPLPQLYLGLKAIINNE